MNEISKKPPAGTETVSLNAAGVTLAPSTAGHEKIAPTESTPWGKFFTDDEYFPMLKKKALRPTLWRWKDLMPHVREVAKDPLRRADRRFISLVSEDTDNAGALPTVFIGIQAINPGEHIVPHRHTSYAIYHIVQGEGYSIVEGQKFEWTRGDTFTCPPWALHEHICTGAEQAIQYVIQDLPGRAADRALLWEEPVGRTFLMGVTALPHSD